MIVLKLRLTLSFVASKKYIPFFDVAISVLKNSVESSILSSSLLLFSMGQKILRKNCISLLLVTISDTIFPSVMRPDCDKRHEISVRNSKGHQEMGQILKN